MVFIFPIAFLYSQLFVKIPVPTSDFSSQTVIVTGSNSGLGLEAARLLVRLNAAKVILAVRTPSKGERARTDIAASESKTGGKGNTADAIARRIEVWQLDISDHNSIKAFVQRAAGLERLDAVIQNAGINALDYRHVEGVEATIATNVIGPCLFGELILPVLQRSAKRHGSRGRLAFVGSDTMYFAEFPEAGKDGVKWTKNAGEGVDLMEKLKITNEKEYNGVARYVADLSVPLPTPSIHSSIHCDIRPNHERDLQAPPLTSTAKGTPSPKPSSTTPSANLRGATPSKPTRTS